MAMVTLANLGDAALSLPTNTVNASGTLFEGGVIFVNNTSAGPIALTLADALGLVLIKDIAGNAGTYPITISATSIDAGTSLVLSVPRQWLWLQWNGSGYSVMG